MGLEGDLAGKGAIVTGASSGIGAAVAETFARAGADVALSGRDPGKLETVAASVREHGRRAHVVAHDLALDAEPGRLVDEAREALGAVNIVVHSAGLFESTPLLETSLDSFDRQFALNVRACFLLTQAAVTHMTAGDALVFVSSIAGHVAFPNSVAYCGTKGALELMAKALCTELAPVGIRVNIDRAGQHQDTPMNASLRTHARLRGRLQRAHAGRSLRRDGQEIADVAVFLASDNAKYVHGASLLVDGGWTAR